MPEKETTNHADSWGSEHPAELPPPAWIIAHHRFHVIIPLINALKSVLAAIKLQDQLSCAHCSDHYKTEASTFHCCIFTLMN